MVLREELLESLSRRVMDLVLVTTRIALLEELSHSFNASLPRGWSWTESLLASFRPVVKGLSDLRDPMHVYVQCLECVPVL